MLVDGEAKHEEAEEASCQRQHSRVSTPCTAMEMQEISKLLAENVEKHALRRLSSTQASTPERVNSSSSAISELDSPSLRVHPGRPLCSCSPGSSRPKTGEGISHTDEEPGAPGESLSQIGYADYPPWSVEISMDVEGEQAAGDRPGSGAGSRMSKEHREHRLWMSRVLFSIADECPAIGVGQTGKRHSSASILKDLGLGSPMISRSGSTPILSVSASASSLNSRTMRPRRTHGRLQSTLFSGEHDSSQAQRTLRGSESASDIQRPRSTSPARIACRGHPNVPGLDMTRVHMGYDDEDQGGYEETSHASAGSGCRAAAVRKGVPLLNMAAVSAGQVGNGEKSEGFAAVAASSPSPLKPSLGHNHEKQLRSTVISFAAESYSLERSLPLSAAGSPGRLGTMAQPSGVRLPPLKGTQRTANVLGRTKLPQAQVVAHLHSHHHNHYHVFRQRPGLSSSAMFKAGEEPAGRPISACALDTTPLPVAA
mmetsp:Transcript_28171/g.61507  ORF Transcript_28171/g.61507 Transcript_28171/m.61507 type:complete len:483 (-) Transcript_28171:71-1519(-)